jgi:hypothetical protein
VEKQRENVLPAGKLKTPSECSKDGALFLNAEGSDVKQNSHEKAASELSVEKSQSGSAHQTEQSADQR